MFTKYRQLNCTVNFFYFVWSVLVYISRVFLFFTSPGFTPVVQEQSFRTWISFFWQIITSVCWVHAGRQVACSYSDGNIVLWSMKNETKPEKIFTPHGKHSEQFEWIMKWCIKIKWTRTVLILILVTSVCISNNTGSKGIQD